jgi:glycosyltransferase involved in cell wall biosynthesis
MEISFYTVDGNLDKTNGYGNSAFQLIRALQSQGYTVPFDDSEAPIQFSFCQPNHYKFHEGQYKIGYTPWESTELPDGWLERMNACDEIWATSEWVAGVYKRAGVKVPITVVHHGLDPKWAPFKRESGEVTNFFHHGEPALRKGGQMTLDAFRQAFGDREDVHLTFKANSQHYLRAWHDGKFMLPNYNNVTIITELYFENELVELYKTMDVMVYPTYGEGFGLIPLQALGTGMPVIGTYKWAPYQHYIDLKVGANEDRSAWPVHPGNVLFPDFQDLKFMMRQFMSDKERWTRNAFLSAPAVHAEFNWATIAKEVGNRLEKVIENR